MSTIIEQWQTVSPSSDDSDVTQDSAAWADSSERLGPENLLETSSSGLSAPAAAADSTSNTLENSLEMWLTELLGDLDSVKEIYMLRDAGSQAHPLVLRIWTVISPYSPASRSAVYEREAKVLDAFERHGLEFDFCTMPEGQAPEDGYRRIFPK